MACRPGGSLPHFNLILLGKSGVGKSATGNTILGRKAFFSESSSRSTTQNVQMENVVIDGVSVDVYDTPGIFSTEMSNEDVMEKCRSRLPLDGRVPAVFLLVIPVERFTAEHRDAVEEAQKIIGERHCKNTWILLTRGDALERDGQSVQRYIKNSTHLKQLAEKFNNRYLAFNNNAQNPAQVQELLHKIRESVKKRTPSRNIILLGKSGSGKSATANSILGRQQFTSRTGHRSVTLVTQKAEVTVRDVSINVFDTPGLCNTEIRHEEVIREYRCLSLFADSRPTVFLLVLRAERPTQEDLRAVRDIETLLGDQLLQHTWILFTRGDELDREGLSVDEFIQGSNFFKQVTSRFNNRFYTFNNTVHRSAPYTDQVPTLLDKIEASLLISGELMKMTLTVKDKPPSRNIILLGKSGSGKSATANGILGRQQFTSRTGHRSVTLVTQKAEVTVRDVSINVFDTPGLCNTEIRHEEVIREYRCLSLFADSRPTVFLLVLRAERPTQEDLRAVRDIETLLGDQLLRHTWILFTRGDELEREDLTIEQFIQDTEELKRIVQRFRRRFHVFNNKRHDPDQVRRLVEKILMSF